MPKIKIESDGSHKGTKLSVDGKPVDNVKQIHFAHYGDQGYPQGQEPDPHFEFHTHEDTGKDGFKRYTRHTFSKGKAGLELVSVEIVAEEKKETKANIYLFSSSHPKVKDHKNHFAILNSTHATKVLTYLGALTDSPAWWNGSLEEFKKNAKQMAKKISDEPGVLNYKKKDGKNTNIYAHPGNDAPELTTSSLEDINEQYKTIGMVKKVGSQYCVFNEAGTKQIACHPDKQGAIKQLQAIEISKHKRGK